MKTLFSISLLLIYFQVFAQNFCGTDEQHHFLLKNSNDYRTLFENQKALVVNQYAQDTLRGNPDTIPIVVHIISLGGAIGSKDNPSDSAIHKMIDNLNLYFKGTYPDPWGLNQSAGVDVGMFFKLAQRTPDCKPANGINRVNASSNINYVTNGVSVAGSAGIFQQELANLSYWNNRKYLNIWIVNKLGSFAGYAYYGVGFETINDGVLILYDAISGPILAHEVGHSFSLLHTFEGSSSTTCGDTSHCDLNGDRVCDTDPVLNNSDGCISSMINPCTNAPYGNVGYNHMSYACHAIFTAGQKNRMRTALSAIRNCLLIFDGELPPPCADLEALTAKINECNTVLLKWKTTQEQDNKGFAIEYSSNGIDFYQMAFIKGQGTIYNISDYTYTTPALSNGENYFRFKQVEFSGKFKYSNVVKVLVDCSKTVYLIRPNPVTSSVAFVTNSSLKNDISICNILGQKVKSWSNTLNKTFDVSDLANGNYILIINESTKLKFVKQ